MESDWPLDGLGWPVGIQHIYFNCNFILFKKNVKKKKAMGQIRTGWQLGQCCYFFPSFLGLRKCAIEPVCKDIFYQTRTIGLACKGSYYLKDNELSWIGNLGLGKEGMKEINKLKTSPFPSISLLTSPAHKLIETCFQMGLRFKGYHV